MEHIAPLTPDSPRTALPAPPRAPGTHAPSSGPCFSSSRDVAIHQLSASLVTVTFFACFRLGCLYLSLLSSYSPFFYLLLGLGFLQIAYQGCSTEWGRKEAHFPSPDDSFPSPKFRVFQKEAYSHLQRHMIYFKGPKIRNQKTSFGTNSERTLF